MRKRIPLPSQERLKELLTYNPQNGSSRANPKGIRHIKFAIPIDSPLIQVKNLSKDELPYIVSMKSTGFTVLVTPNAKFLWAASKTALMFEPGDYRKILND